MRSLARVPARSAAHSPTSASTTTSSARSGRRCSPGTRRCFFLARNATVDRVIEAIRPYNPTVIQTNLSRESEQELIEALQRDYLAGPTGTTMSS